MATYDENPVPGPRPADGGLRTPRLIARDNLLATLDRAAASKVTVISAPAGSGKRRCCARGPTARIGPAYRLHAGSAGARTTRSCSGSPCSARPVTPRTGSDTEPPTAASDFSGRAMVDRVLSRARRPDACPFVLVIDDLHELRSRGCRAQLTSAADPPSPERPRDPDHPPRPAAAGCIGCGWPAS